MRGSLKLPLISVSFSTAAKTTEKKERIHAGTQPGIYPSCVPYTDLIIICSVSHASSHFAALIENSLVNDSCNAAHLVHQACQDVCLRLL